MEKELEPIDFHDGDTMDKVYAAMRAAGLADQQITDAVSQLLNAGVFFRERRPEAVS